MPPVTTRPENGSRLHTFWMYSGMRWSSVVTVADSHLVCGMCEPNTSGRPKSGCFAAIRRHRSQAGAGPSFSFAGVRWSPLSEFSVSEPIVVNSRSSAVSSTPPGSPSRTQCSAVACLRPSAKEKSTSVTSVPYWNTTPCSSSHFTSGSTSDSYWLYLVNFSAEKSGSPPMWWTKRCR